MEDLEKVTQAVIAELVGYLATSHAGQEPVVGYESIEGVTAQLELRRRLDSDTVDTMDLGDLVAFVRRYCALSASHHHPGYLAHQIAPPDVPSVVADLLRGVTNNIPLIYELAPGGSAVDRAVYSWMLERAGWGETGTGTLTSGGSLGNLTALLAARSYTCPESWQQGNRRGMVVLAPPSSHYSLRKAAAVMGLGERGLVPLPVDALGRIDVERLPSAIAEVRARDSQPLAVVANACATATGLHDSLADIGRICAAEDVWLHVDGAHGASALLSPQLRDRFDGLRHANSLTWDTHKMLRTSALCTGVLVRTAGHFEGLFQQEASYLFHEDARHTDMGQRTLETSKPPLGLNLFLNLAYRGESAYRRYVEEQYEKAHVLWRLIRERDDFTCPYRPESNILCFRYAPLPDQQLAIRDRLRQAGHFYLSSAMVDGQTYLRAAIMAPATDESALQRLLDEIATTAGEL